MPLGRHQFEGSITEDICNVIGCGKSKYSDLHWPIEYHQNFEEALKEFHKSLDEILLFAAKTKGYHGAATDGRKLFDEAHTENYGHPIGEIKYKLRRFQSTRDPIDIVKVAAWAFLIWDKQRRG